LIEARRVKRLFTKAADTGQRPAGPFLALEKSGPPLSPLAVVPSGKGTPNYSERSSNPAELAIIPRKGNPQPPFQSGISGTPPTPPGVYTVPITASTDRQSTTDLITIKIKKETFPWSQGSVITKENVSPNLSIIKVAHDKSMNDDDQRFIRLILQIIE